MSSSGEDEDVCEEKDSGEGFVVVGGCFGHDTRHATYFYRRVVLVVVCPLLVRR